jgi:3' terminal RNA ribose 2'-O-methyltransferase Hen1
VETLKENSARSVIDMGCGEGKLLRLLLREKTFERIAGFDVSLSVLEHAKENLHVDEMPEAQQKRITLFQGSFIYHDRRFFGWDAAALIEVIEHLEPEKLDALAAVVFGEAAPRVVVLSTPNRDYNVNYPFLADGKLRHPDHRFEWTRAEFRAWTEMTAGKYHYQVSWKNIGEKDEQYGSPTQMAVFIKNEN